MMLAHKIALDPNNVQATYFRKAAGTARFAYNCELYGDELYSEAWRTGGPWTPGKSNRVWLFWREGFHIVSHRVHSQSCV